MTSTKSYNAESCHEIGYRWTIIAPANVEPEQIEQLQHALVSWSDEPNTEHIHELLNDPEYRGDFKLIDIAGLRKVTIDVQPVHRDCFAQNFRYQRTTEEGGQ